MFEPAFASLSLSRLHWPALACTGLHQSQSDSQPTTETLAGTLAETLGCSRLHSPRVRRSAQWSSHRSWVDRGPAFGGGWGYRQASYDPTTFFCKGARTSL